MDFVFLLSKRSLPERVLLSLVLQAPYWIATGSMRSSSLINRNTASTKANATEESALSSFKVQLATKMRN